MKILNEHQRKLLTDLLAWGGVATSANLGGYSLLSARARTKSKRDGLVTFDGGGRHGYWRITDAGREVLRTTDTEAGFPAQAIKVRAALERIIEVDTVVSDGGKVHDHGPCAEIAIQALRQGIDTDA